MRLRTIYATGKLPRSLIIPSIPTDILLQPQAVLRVVPPDDSENIIGLLDEAKATATIDRYVALMAWRARPHRRKATAFNPTLSSRLNCAFNLIPAVAKDSMHLTIERRGCCYGGAI